ncbi:MAG: iron ABC transporter permease [Planctomycetes bacterium]|nr:iron ABC transporter permease [Planctomycetota bacterium]
MPLRRRAPLLALGLAVVLAALVVSLGVGVIDVPFGEVLAILGGRDDGASLHRTLVLDMRLPRAVGALTVGAALGAAGVLLQALLRDALASPTIIGTAQASGFGRVLGVFVGLGYAGSVGLSFVMALAGTLLVLATSRSRRGFPAQTVLLTGVNVGMLFAALIGLLQYLSRDEGQLSRMVLMLLGGLWQVTWAPLAWIAPLAAVLVAAALLLARHLDLLSLGEEDARRLGQHTQSVGTLVLVLACALTSLAVSIAGVIAFVGLVVPHAARRLVGPVHAALLPASALLGGLLVLATDCVARTAAQPNELPLGVLTSLIGVPCFLAVLHSMARKGAAR